mgnify:CR=1 FL=1
MTAVTSQIQSVASSAMPVMLAERSTSAMILVGFLADVGLYKYLNVPFPENFVLFCRGMESLDLPNIFANMDSENGGNNPNSKIGKFKFWEISVTLLDNSSFTIAKELILLAIILGLNILVFLLKESSKTSNVLRKVRTLFMWNVFLSNYLGDFSELLLNGMIQMRENNVSSAYAIFSFALAVIIVSSYSLLGMYFRYLLNKRHPRWTKIQERSSIPTANRSKEKWDKVPDSLGFLVEDFREKSKFARNFVLVMLLETFLQILVVFFFQNNGLTQAFLYIIIVLVLFSLSAWKRPYKSKLHMGILLLNQGTKLVMGIIATIFGINDLIQFISSELINLIGFVLILLIVIVMGINLAVSLLIVILSNYYRIKEWRSKRKKERSNFRARRTERASKKHDYMDERSPSKLEQSSLDFHVNSKGHAHQQVQNSEEWRFRLARRSRQSLKPQKIFKNNSVYHCKNKLVSEIHMAEST